MKKIISTIAVLISFMLALFIATDCCWATIYKYKDKNGVWHFSDTPVQLPENFEETTESEGISKDLQKQLAESNPPRNKIEKAVNATVKIKTVSIQGSGFFITEDGYIITNKHVTDPLEMIRESGADFVAEFEQNKTMLSKLEEELLKRDAWLKKEKEWIRITKDELDKISKKIESHQRNNRLVRKYNKLMRPYNTRVKKYIDLNEEYERLLWEFQKNKEVFNKKYEEYIGLTKGRRYNRNFTIYLADNTELQAEKVATSDQYDLALLKLEGYKIPCIKPGSAFLIKVGDPVYVIGAPADLRVTVTSGVLSGNMKHYLQTNAQINPGCSGGPLVNEDGEVIGVNTRKVVGTAYEGIGFAIPINIAIQEFKNIIGSRIQIK